MEFSTRERFKILPDGSFYASAGVFTNCAGCAGIHLRIAFNQEKKFVFEIEENDSPAADDDNVAVPGPLVPTEYQEAVAEGAKEAYEQVGIDRGLTVVLIDAFLHAVDARRSKFKQAGHTAVQGFLESQK